MPGVKVRMGSKYVTYVDFVDDYKPGDPAPEGYCEWHAWAEVQHKAGLRQKQCAHCLKWKYPQELSDQTITSIGHIGKPNGPEVRITSPICLQCAVRREG